MGVSVLKQLMREMQDSADSAGRHMNVGMPSLFKKHSRKLADFRTRMKQTDMEAARRANLDAFKRGEPEKAIDLSDAKAVRGAADREFRDAAGADAVDTVIEGMKYLKNGNPDMSAGERGREVIQYALDGVKDPETRLKLSRTVYRSVLAEVGSNVKGDVKDGIIEGIFDTYVQVNVGDQQLKYEDFKDYLDEVKK